MTKERRLAVEMWEQIAEHISDPYFNLQAFKCSFCREHNLKWQNSCWFCQYVRKDYRSDMPSRAGIDEYSNRCQHCPIYKYERCEEDTCGCSVTIDSLYYKVCNDCHKTSVRVKAAKTIARLLKGEEVE